MQVFKKLGHLSKQKNKINHSSLKITFNETKKKFPVESTIIYQEVFKEFAIIKMYLKLYTNLACSFQQSNFCFLHVREELESFEADKSHRVESNPASHLYPRFEL